MRAITLSATIFALFLTIGPARADEPARMQVQVNPYYNSDGLLISVGPLSTELTDATKETIPALTTKMKQQWDTLPVEAMYVMAIRLFDLGLKDEAVFWCYAAQWRAFLYRDTIPPDKVGGQGSPAFEHIEANKSFHQLCGRPINAYAVGDLPKLQKTLEAVKTQSQRLPKLATIYPGQKFIPESVWPDKNEQVAKGFAEMIEYLQKNPELIKAIQAQGGAAK